MFAEVGGRVWLAEWAADGSLGEATAAQLGFDYEPEPPFAGRKGRTRLAVVDGLVNPDVARLLVGALAPEEKLVLCGTAVDPDVTQALRELRPGSRARKIPASILAEYRIGLEWRYRSRRRSGSTRTRSSRSRRGSTCASRTSRRCGRSPTRPRSTTRSTSRRRRTSASSTWRPGSARRSCSRRRSSTTRRSGGATSRSSRPAARSSDKTIANFTPGHPKSLLGGMDVEPLVVTGENFATVDHAEEDRVRLYVFSVQSLLKPTGKQGRARTRSTRRSATRSTPTCRSGTTSSSSPTSTTSTSGRRSRPRSATSSRRSSSASPRRRTRRRRASRSSTRYPLAHAIADRLVKTPVIVGPARRAEGRADKARRRHPAARGEARRGGALLRRDGRGAGEPGDARDRDDDRGGAERERHHERPRLLRGRYATPSSLCTQRRPTRRSRRSRGRGPGSPVRIIVSVGMLKEGWDVKNVYAICSLRPLLSDVLRADPRPRPAAAVGRYTGVRTARHARGARARQVRAAPQEQWDHDEEFVD